MELGKVNYLQIRLSNENFFHVISQLRLITYDGIFACALLGLDPLLLNPLSHLSYYYQCDNGI